jgi:hypothetical protein
MYPRAHNSPFAPMGTGWPVTVSANLDFGVGQQLPCSRLPGEEDVDALFEDFVPLSSNRLSAFLLLPVRAAKAHYPRGRVLFAGGERTWRKPKSKCVNWFKTVCNREVAALRSSAQRDSAAWAQG